MKDYEKICELCERSVETLTRHHLTPKSRGGGRQRVIMVCISCKDMIHRLHTNKELERVYNTLEKLNSSLKIKKYIMWIRNKKSERIPMALKKRKL